MARIDGRNAFMKKPDLSLMDGDRTAFILDAKWKRINPHDDDPKHGIDQGDVYQIYAFARAYKCDVVALVYPRTRIFCQPLQYRILDGPRLICLPFDVEDPEDSVMTALRTLCNLASQSGLPGIRSSN